MTSSNSDQSASDFCRIPFAPDYTVSSAGIVISYKTSNPKILKYGFDGSGRITVSINSKPVCVANLVRQVFGLSLCPYTLKPATAPLPTPSDLIEQAKTRFSQKRQRLPQQLAQASGGSGGTSPPTPPPEPSTAPPERL